MPQAFYGKKHEPPIQLLPADDLIAVRTRSGRSLTAAAPVRSAVAREVDDGQLVARYPEAGVEVYKLPTTRLTVRSLEQRKQNLRDHEDVRFAGGVLTDTTSGEPVLYTENIFIKFTDDMEPGDCRAVIQEAGLTVKDHLDFATNAFFVSAPEGTGQRVFEIAEKLLQREDVEYCHPELIRRREKKQIAQQQWHLHATAVNGVPVNAHTNVASAHEVTRGEGITIAVIDDGVDIDHREFAAPGKIVAPRDATIRVQNPAAPPAGWNNARPKDSFLSDDNHGTACAGVACADGIAGASGVAPKARLMPIRLANGIGSINEAVAFRWAAENGADVISCSWGPEDGKWPNPDDPLHTQLSPLPAHTRLAIEFATTQGRNGKGCVVLFAAGNGNESVDLDGYASFDQVIAVAACNDRGKRSVYSDFGKAVWCAFPSGDEGFPPFNHPRPLTPGIWTTDRSGARGYNDGNVRDGDTAGDYTNSFSGTSSACPGAAGVAALVLSANPDLKWHEVKDVLRRAGEKIDPQNGQYDANGHSPFYGFGRLNARTAVDLARPQPKTAIVVSRRIEQRLPDLQTTTVALEVAESGTITQVTVSVDIAHTFVGDLVLTLIPPVATGAGRIVLQRNLGGTARTIVKAWDAAAVPALAALAGKQCRGTWELEIQDTEAVDDGTLKLFSLEIGLAQPVARAVAASEGADSR